MSLKNKDQLINSWCALDWKVLRTVLFYYGPHPLRYRAESGLLLRIKQKNKMYNNNNNNNNNDLVVLPRGGSSLTNALTTVLQKVKPILNTII